MVPAVTTNAPDDVKPFEATVPPFNVNVPPELIVITPIDVVAPEFCVTVQLPFTVIVPKDVVPVIIEVPAKTTGEELPPAVNVPVFDQFPVNCIVPELLCDNVPLVVIEISPETVKGNVETVNVETTLPPSVSDLHTAAAVTAG